jgi:predicted CoA-binding protein
MVLVAEVRAALGRGLRRKPESRRSWNIAPPTTLADDVTLSSREILENAHTIAVVGASRDPRKAAGSVPEGLQRRGFRIIPVNPYADTLFGERVYRSLLEVPEKIDVVDVFRPAADTPDIARQAAAIGAKALWLQLDIRSEEARRIAEQAGMDYVEDECTGVVASLNRIRKPAA